MNILAAHLTELTPPLRLLAQEAGSHESGGVLVRLLQHPSSVFMVTIVLLSIVVLVPILAGIWYKLRVKELEASLKHTMLERGMSAEEISSILNAGGGCGHGNKAVLHAIYRGGPQAEFSNSR